MWDEDLGVEKKSGPKGKQYNEVTVVYCLEAMEKTNGWAIPDEISCDTLGHALIIKQKLALYVGLSQKRLSVRKESISAGWDWRSDEAMKMTEWESKRLTITWMKGDNTKE